MFFHMIYLTPAYSWQWLFLATFAPIALKFWSPDFSFVEVKSENLKSIHLFMKGYEISVLVMKFLRTPLGGLLLAALLVICFAFHSIFAMEEIRRRKDSNTNDWMEVAEKRSQPQRERRAVK